MLDHGIILTCGGCRMRPEREEDRANALKLWNAPFVVGKLFMSKTTEEVYKKYFDRYKENPDEFRWIVEDSSGAFVGTVGVTRLNDKIARGNAFALWPTEFFLPAAPTILLQKLVFEIWRMDELISTCLASNKKIKKHLKILGGERYAPDTIKKGSNGRMIVLENWRYTKETYKANYSFFKTCCQFA